MIDARPKSFFELVGFPGLGAGVPADEIHGTTVLALRFDGGVVLLADRRATMGNLVMYDQADKIVPLDDTTVVAISGSYARSLEVCRLLKHSFKYYKRMHLNDMSLEGKLQEISRALAANLPMAMQGIGVFLPIVAAYDTKSKEFDVYFFDGAGARFQNADYACAGSGSERIRGVFEYLVRSKGHWHTRSLDDVLDDGLRMLDIAADLDSATGGFGKVLPAVKVLDVDGVRDLEAEAVERAARAILAQG